MNKILKYKYVVIFNFFTQNQRVGQNQNINENFKPFIDSARFNKISCLIKK